MAVYNFTRKCQTFSRVVPGAVSLSFSTSMWGSFFLGVGVTRTQGGNSPTPGSVDKLLNVRHFRSPYPGTPAAQLGATGPTVSSPPPIMRWGH